DVRREIRTGRRLPAFLPGVRERRFYRSGHVPVPESRYAFPEGLADVRKIPGADWADFRHLQRTESRQSHRLQHRLAGQRTARPQLREGERCSYRCAQIPARRGDQLLIYSTDSLVSKPALVAETHPTPLSFR